MTLDIRSRERFRTLPDAVLFDTDNTLYPYPPAHRAGIEASRKKAKELLSLEPRQFDDLYARARRDVKARLQGTASAHSRLLYFQRIFELLGLKTQVLLTLDLQQTYWRSFLSSVELFPGTRAFLGELRYAGIPTAVVTDLTAVIQFRKLVYLGLDSEFDYVITSEEAGRDKPDPAPFELALEKLNITRGTLWMIGDQPIDDIRGARETISAITLQKRHQGVEVAESADLVFGHYDELRQLFAELTARR